MKKILHLESSPGWGGQEMRILKESKEMRKRGHSVFFALNHKGKLKNEARLENFLVFDINYKKKYWLFSLFKLIKIIKKLKIDIVNTHSSEDSWLGGIATRICRKKIIRTRHLSTNVKGGLNSLLLYNYLTDFVVTTSYVAKKEITFRSKKEKSLIKSIPTGVDIEKVISKKEDEVFFRKKHKIPKDNFLVGTACFMRSWKGIKDFIKAAKDLKGITFIIIGGGHEKEYKEFAKKLNLKNLIFTGHLKNPFPAISSLDIFLLLSTAHEGVSQATLQAAYLEKPIIGTNIGGIPEVCIDNKTGIIVPAFSKNNVVKAILKLKNDKNLRKKMGESGKKLVIDNFTNKKMADEMEDIYLKLLKKN